MAVTKSFSRRALFLALSAIALLALFYVFRTEALAASANFLVVRDKLDSADIIFLLNGDLTTRPAHAAKLLREGMASRIVIARAEDSPGVQIGAYPNVTDSNIAVLRGLGVPESKIVQLRWQKGVAHTFDEARALFEYSQENPVHTVILVTSDLHSRRARFIFRKVLKGTSVRIISAPVSDLKYGAHNWWTVEDGVIGVQNEYVKLLYYYLKY